MTFKLLQIIIQLKLHLEDTMESVRINVSIPKKIFDELSQEVESRKRSRFITEAIMRSIKERRDQRLAEEYREAAAEIRQINKELEGAISDGLD